MKNNGNLYTADEGNFIIRKSDGFVMGTEIDLGSADNIDNYEEKPYTQEEYKEFCEKYGIETPNKNNVKHKNKQDTYGN